MLTGILAVLYLCVAAIWLGVLFYGIAKTNGPNGAGVVISVLFLAAIWPLTMIALSACRYIDEVEKAAKEEGGDAA